MENDFTDIAKLIEKRRLKIIEALRMEEKSLGEVNKTLNKRYQESLIAVLNGLTNSMETQGKELLKRREELLSEALRNESREILKEQNLLKKNILKLNQEMLQNQKDLLSRMNKRSYIMPILIIVMLAVGGVLGWLIKPKPSLVVHQGNGEIVKTKDEQLWIRKDLVSQVVNLKIIEKRH